MLFFQTLSLDWEPGLVTLNVSLQRYFSSIHLLQEINNGIYQLEKEDFQSKEQFIYSRSQNCRVVVNEEWLNTSAAFSSGVLRRITIPPPFVLNTRLGKRAEDNLSALTASQASQSSMHCSLSQLSPHPRHYYLLHLYFTFQINQTSN